MSYVTPYAWSEDEYQIVSRLAQTTSYRAIGERYGITRSAVANRLWRYRLRCGDNRPRVPRQLTARDVARVLGCSFNTVRRWQVRGALLFPLTASGGRPACIIRDVLDFLEAGYALYPSIQPPATELFWAQAVKRIRRDLQRRWIDQAILCNALGISQSVLHDWRNRGFPQRTIYLGVHGTWLDRQAVSAWLDEHGHWTKAARRLMEDV